MNRIRGAIIGLTLIMAIGACGPGAAAPSATPTPAPRELVVAALRSTAALQSVHVLVNLGLHEVNGAGQDYEMTFEGEVDVVARELDLSGRFKPAIFGAETARLVIVDGFLYGRLGTDEWSVSGGPRQDVMSGVPTTALVAKAVEGAIQDPATTVTDDGTEACGDATCHRIRVEVPREVAWAAVMDITATFRAEGAPPMEMPAEFPGFAIDLWIEVGTGLLRQANNTTISGGQRITITVALSDHGKPVTIVPPIPPVAP